MFEFNMNFTISLVGFPGAKIRKLSLSGALSAEFSGFLWLIQLDLELQQEGI